MNIDTHAQAEALMWKPLKVTETGQVGTVTNHRLRRRGNELHVMVELTVGNTVIGEWRAEDLNHP